ncbi:MAG: hypothetical protein QME51_03615 [Planctomycetota bacterium]|nr:hypothetical protein [Planctomycetota bacterium]MDI6787438.1 hypothetical protein [Planctomycetota bacterium]
MGNDCKVAVRFIAQSGAKGATATKNNKRWFYAFRKSSVIQVKPE